ncbi:MAG: TauD/TfdA dioxygenase family protein [Kiloniellales bacterium]
MAVTAIKLHRLFGAEIRGVDLTKPLDDPTFGAVLDAFNEYSVLLFRGQKLTDDQQVAFSRRFGPLETTVKSNPARGTHFARQSNIDIATGRLIPPDDRQMALQKPNLMWHSDSSFKPVPALCSLLSARRVPPEGGETELVSTRAAYAALPAEMKRRIDGLVAVHSYAYSRSQVDPDLLTEEEKAEVPPVEQALVRTNPVNGRKSLLIGSHASHIVGWPVEDGRALLKELLEFATRARFRYRHRWRVNDLVIWDNRCTLHRARSYDSRKYRRLMQRTTVVGTAATV